MHWLLVQSIVADCDEWVKKDNPRMLHNYETLAFCVVELAAQLRRVNRALMDEAKRVQLPDPKRASVPASEGPGK